MSEPTISVAVRPNRFRHFVLTTTGVIGLALAAYLPFALQQGTFALPIGSISQTVQPTSGLVVKPKPAQHGATAWTYDFTNRPDGRLSRLDWNFETGSQAADYNGEAQAYTSNTQNVRIQDGTLIIEAKPQSQDGKQYTSGRVNTLSKFDFTYGTLEVDMKLPSGVGTWPAAWLLPADNKYKLADYAIPSSNPYAWALNGEIDFAEAVGYIPGQNIPAIHSYNEVQRAPTYTPGYVPTSTSEFHRYGVIKTPDSITFTIDGVPYNTRHKTSDNPLEWPYDQPYYLILDLAIGGKWAGAHGIDDTSAPWRLQVKDISYKPL